MTSLPDRLPERILVLRCQAGDEAAFEEVVSTFGPRLRYYVYKLLGRSEVAEDTMQEVWLDVHRGIARLQNPEAFRTWLYRIARDRAFRALRKERPHPQLIDDTDLTATEAENGGFSDEDAERIHSALDKLSAGHREVLLLRFIEDLPYEEIAQITGSPLGTVKSRIHFAKRLLRKEMERMSDHE